jgi:hypothetical protein
MVRLWNTTSSIEVTYLSRDVGQRAKGLMEYNEMLMYSSQEPSSSEPFGVATATVKDLEMLQNELVDKLHVDVFKVTKNILLTLYGLWTSLECGTAKQLSLSRTTALISTSFRPSFLGNAFDRGIGR